MNSHLLVGKVRHRRARPFVYQLEHDVFYFAVDLGELDEVTTRGRLVRRNRRGVVTFRDADHLPTPAVDIDADVRAHLRAEGHEPAGWQITLITNLRVFGYVFNPASFFLCRDAAGELRVVIVEVHNTFGGRHLYTLRPGAQSEPFNAAMSKEFFVSPFISVDGRYAVHVRDDAEGVRLSIVLRQDEEVLLSTSLLLRRRRLTDRALFRLLLRHPFMTQRTMGLITWHALLLKLRGARFYRHSRWKQEAAEAGHAAEAGRAAEAAGAGAAVR